MTGRRKMNYSEPEFFTAPQRVIPEEKGPCWSGEVASRDSRELIGCRHSGDIFQTELSTCLHNCQLASGTDSF